jgi:hypothetical protein
MYTSAAEIAELEAMRKNIRESVATLELCWSCQRVSDCDIAMVDDAAPVWLCGDCQDKFLSQERLGALLWPSPWEVTPDGN